MNKILFLLYLSTLSFANSTEHNHVHKVSLIMPNYQIWKFQEMEKNPEMRVLKFKFENTKVSFDDGGAVAAKIGFRGQSCLKQKRPCFEVKAEESITLHEGVKGKDFDLNSMAQDLGYIHSRLGFITAERIGLPVMNQEYVELEIKDEDGKNIYPLGLYLLLVKPVDYALKHEKAEYVSRRRYSGFEFKKTAKSTELSQEKYDQGLLELMVGLEKWQGQTLLDELKKRLDLDYYLRWLAMNTLLKNGDYSDEVFFLGYPSSSGVPFYKIMPLDFDDLFKPIHHIPLMTTSCSGFEYAPIYNCENLLDRVLVTDPVAYTYLLHFFRHIFQTELANEFMQDNFKQVWREVLPYVKMQTLMKISKKDPKNKHYTESFVQELLDSRQKEVRERREQLLKQIEQELQRLQK